MADKRRQSKIGSTTSHSASDSVHWDPELCQRYVFPIAYLESLCQGMCVCSSTRKRKNRNRKQKKNEIIKCDTLYAPNWRINSIKQFML